jgi:PAP2 superfamily
MQFTDSIGKKTSFFSLLRVSAAGDSLLLAYISFCSLVAWLAIASIPGFRTAPPQIFAAGLFTLITPLMAMSFIILKFYSYVTRERPKSPARQLLADAMAIVLDRVLATRALVMFVGLTLFAILFTLGKGNITVVHPFSWDQALDALDVQLHFGYRPWEILQPVLGYWPVTLLLNLHYNFWFLAVIMAWTYFMLIEKPGFDRTRYFLAFLLTWSIGGVFLATWFSSAGPVYFSQTTGLNTYLPLMSYLRETNDTVPIWAVSTQELLWQIHTRGSVIGGVSAMPSMHSAVALLLALTLWNRGTFLRWIGISHVVLIFLGSVHLGWHYAIDGYLGWALALMFWKVAGKAARWWDEQPAQITYRNLAGAGNI